MCGAEHAGRGLEVPEPFESASYVLWRILLQLLKKMLAERAVIVFNVFILRLSKISVSFAASHSGSAPFRVHRHLWRCALRTLEDFSEKPGRAEWDCFYLSPTRVCNFFPNFVVSDFTVPLGSQDISVGVNCVLSVWFWEFMNPQIQLSSSQNSR